MYKRQDVVATARGYVLREGAVAELPTRLVKVHHTVDDVEDELNTIVDLGGAVTNVMVNHRVYGKITADLDVRNRSAISADVQVQPERDFSGRAERGVVKPACKIVEQCEDDGSSPAWPKQEHRLENPVVSARGVSTKVTLGRTK